MSFDFKQFSIDDRRCAMKVGTDGVLLGAWCDLPQVSNPYVLDLGAGSGLIALMIAQRCPGASVVGVEIDPEAARDCEDNFARSPFSRRLKAITAAAADFIPDQAPDLIVSNPPYFTGGELSPNATRRQARHQADFGPFAAIDIAARLLAPGGALAMVTPADFEADLLFHAELNHLTLSRLCRVSTIDGRPPSRLLWQFLNPTPPTPNSPLQTPHSLYSTLAIRTPDHRYTPAYTSLTSEFYLNF